MTTKTVKIIPDFANLVEWMAINMAQQGFIRDAYGPMGSILQTFGYMAKHDPVRANIVLQNLERKEKGLPRLEMPPQDDSLYEQDEEGDEQ